MPHSKEGLPQSHKVLAGAIGRVSTPVIPGFEDLPEGLGMAVKKNAPTCEGRCIPEGRKIKVKGLSANRTIARKRSLYNA